MRDFLAFRKMVTPRLIQIVFWIATIIIVISGVLTIITSVLLFQAASELSQSQDVATPMTAGGGSASPDFNTVLSSLPDPSIFGIVSGVLQILIGPVIIRIICEIALNFFRIQETLVEIRNQGSAQSLANQSGEQNK